MGGWKAWQELRANGRTVNCAALEECVRTRRVGLRHYDHPRVLPVVQEDLSPIAAQLSMTANTKSRWSRACFRKSRIAYRFLNPQPQIDLVDIRLPRCT
jgi:hypothetical protein